jgi:hypothetical protein
VARWVVTIAKHRGAKLAKVAFGRKIGIILLRMWIDGSNVCFSAGTKDGRGPLTLLAGLRTWRAIVR